ncbi:MAG: putative oxidoreductase [Candidatus Parcubacteria bacterium]|nr:putative oxidoreductase [Candidatus Parcubacteria bacterium]
MIGRIIFAEFWLQAAYTHLFKSANLVGYMQSKGMKSAKSAVVGTGFLLLIGGLSMLLGISPKIGVIVLAVFLIGVSFKMHAFWKVTDPMAKSMDRVQFAKNMALLGALLMILMIPHPWAYSLGW